MMIEKVRILRQGQRLTRCFLLDTHGREIAELPITGVDIKSAVNGGTAKLALQSFRVSIEDAER